MDDDNWCSVLGIYYINFDVSILLQSTMRRNLQFIINPKVKQTNMEPFSDTNVKLNFLFTTLGKVPLCNSRIDSALVIFGFCFPLCCRCTFILTGCLVAAWFKWPFGAHGGLISSAIGFGLLPCFIDGAYQYFGGVPSNNWRRGITGFLAGSAVYHISLVITRLGALAIGIKP